jgi:hypothetical protein
MRPFPIWTKGEVAVPFGRPVRADLMPQAVVNFLEDAGYRISELEGNRVSFRGPARSRFLSGYWTQLTSGRVRVETDGQVVQLAYEVSFLVHAILLVLVGSLFVFQVALFEERSPNLKATALVGFLVVAYLGNIVWATRSFGVQARKYLLENLIRYV